MSNILKRTISGILYAALMVLGVFCKPLFPILMLAVTGILLHEFYTVSLGSRYPAERLLATFAGVLFFALVYLVCAHGMPLRLLSLALLPVVCMPVAFIFEKDRSGLESIAFLFFGLVYIALPMGLVPLIQYSTGSFDGHLLMSMLLIVWLDDTGAYCFGTLFGQKPDSRKLAPSISPKKSWWGVYGGVALGIICGIVLKLIGWLDMGMGHCIALSFIISATCVAGDLAESVWKRHFGVKDAGNFIPGHGGLLDRLDSTLVSLAFGGIYLAVSGLI